jgi:ribosomal protein L11 methyltransferase
VLEPALKRVSVSVPPVRAEEARATMIELFPEGFEERVGPDGIELAAYTDSSGEERLWHAFGGARSSAVAPGWEERWREFHRPVRIGRLWVGPPCDAPPPDATVVFVEPGRAFGTGAHATTRLCLELLLDLARGPLLDVGCGSGVIAIAAAKLGFAPVSAIDSDPVAVQSARANAATNGVPVDVTLLDALSEPVPKADTIVANITFAAGLALARRISCRRLVLSGYLASDGLEPARFRKIRRLESEGWAADLFEQRTE